MNSILPSTFCISRDNLNQWEKVTRGEEASIWISSQSLAPGTSDSLPVKIDDWTAATDCFNLKSTPFCFGDCFLFCFIFIWKRKKKRKKESCKMLRSRPAWEGNTHGVTSAKWLWQPISWPTPVTHRKQRENDNPDVLESAIKRELTTCEYKRLALSHGLHCWGLNLKLMGVGGESYGVLLNCIFLVWVSMVLLLYLTVAGFNTSVIWEFLAINRTIYPLLLWMFMCDLLVISLNPWRP